MSKEKSNSMKQLKYSIALPLATVTMFLFTCSAWADNHKETSNVAANDTLPACQTDSLHPVLHFNLMPCSHFDTRNE